MKSSIKIPVVKKRRIIALFLGLMLAFALGIYFYYEQASASHHATATQILKAVVELKADQISQWRKERIADAQTAFQSPFFVDGVQAWLDHPSDAVLKRKILQRLDNLKKENGYADAFIISGSGKVLASIEGTFPQVNLLPDALKDAGKREDIYEHDFYISASDQKTYYDIIVPLRNTLNKQLTLIVLRTNPDDYLYPLLRKWPVPSSSSEVVLSRKEGDSVLFLSNLRFKEHTAMRYKIPLTRTDLPTVQAALGVRGAFEGHDYRGVPAVAYISEIPDTPWLIVAKIDASEILAELQYRSIILVIILGIIILMMGAMFVAFYRSSQLEASSTALEEETERRRYHEEAEMQIRASEEKFRILVEQASDGIFITDAEGRIQDVNPGGCEMLGYAKEKLIGMLMNDLYADIDRSTLLPELDKENAGRPHIEERRMIRKDGTLLPVEFSRKILTDGRMQKFIRDITERKKNEEELKENKALLSDAERIGRIGGWRVDVATLEQRWTDETFSILEYDKSLGAPTMPRGMDFIMPAYRDKAKEGFKRTMEQGEEFEQEWEVETAKGNYLWIHCYARAWWEDGRITRIIGTIQDITQRKQAEAALIESETRFRGLFTNISEVFSICEILYDGSGTPYDFRLLEVNQELEKHVGLTRDQIVGKLARELFPDIDPSLVGIYAKVAETGQPVRFERSSPVTARYYEQFVYSIGQGRVAVLATDITDRKTNEELLRDVQRREAIGVLSAGIAHDFNNLLAVMMGNVSLAQMQMPSHHPVSKYLAQALKSIETAADLTRQILAYSGKGQFQIRTINVGEEIQKHVSLFTISMPKNVKLSLHLPPEPVFISGDPAQIKQIIMNLIMNGADAIGEEEGSVNVVSSSVDLRTNELTEYSKITRTVLNEGRYALLEVKDTGCGMSLETQGRIFDPFFTTKFIGRGLGLSAVLGIIRSQNGGIAIESAEGEGTIFRVILPETKSETETTIAPNEGVTTMLQTNGDMTKLHKMEESVPAPEAKRMILVIDDEEDVASMTKDLLETGNFTVQIEVNPQRGIDFYKKHIHEIGLVLLDLTMPEMSGAEVARLLQEINPEVKIFIASGYSEQEIKKKVPTDKIEGFIQKPFPLDVLLEKVQNAMK
jgi:two-component system, cell cycle sensor histidine kinase and response regulator CckA